MSLVEESDGICKTKQQFEDHINTIVGSEYSRADCFLEESDAADLLADNDGSPLRERITGYPSRPLFKEIGQILFDCMNTGSPPVLRDLNLLDEQGYAAIRSSNFKEITLKLTGLKSIWGDIGCDEIKYRIRDILVCLGKRGLLDLIGLRKTTGSVEKWPPSRRVMEVSFRKICGEGTVLTVGARALAKHYHRDRSSWWGKSEGNEQAKNAHADEVMKKILDNATWINIHQLNPNLDVLEVRHPDGNGIRWSADGSEFRGLLEPQMQDGHQAGWHH